MSDSALRVRLIGGFEIDDVPETRVGSRKGRVLLKRLAVGQGAPVHVDALVDALWGDTPPAHPSEQVAVLVSRLRSVLGATRIPRTDAGYALHYDWLDLAEFDALADEAVARADVHPTSARSAALASLRLVRGELLAGEEGEWAELERARFRRRVASTQRLAAQLLLTGGLPADAATVAEAALGADPFDEAALRLLMLAHVRAGRSASALAAYATTRALLAEELGVDPSRETEELHTAVLLGTVPGVERSERGTALVGRDTDLAVLDTEWAEKQAVLVVGEAGIGKTALLEHWLALHPDAIALVGRCDDLGRDLPLQPVLDAIAVHLRRVDPATARRLLGTHAALVGPLVGVHPDDHEAAREVAPTTVTDLETARVALYEALLDVVERTGDRVVLAIEDLHMAGESTVAWLRFAMRRAARLFLVCTARAAPADLLPGARIVALAPLDVAATATLVGTERADEVHRRSGGNPLYALHLGAAAPGEVPDTLVEVIRARAERLGEAASTLRVAAVLDQEVDVDLVAAACRRPAGVILDHVEQGLAAGLLREEDSTIVFAHAVVRDALAATATGPRRAFAHREVAAALRGRPEVDPSRVALHARLGGDAPAASDALVAAAELAVRRFDTAHALARLDEAVALHDTVAARVARARVHLARSALADAAADAARALELGADPSVYELAGWIAYYQRDYATASRFADDGVANAEDDVIRASCLTLGGRVRHSAGLLHEADDWLGRATALAGTRRLGVTHIWLGCLRAHQGRPADAVASISEAGVDDAAERALTGHPFAPMHALFARAHAEGMRGHHREAVAAWRMLDGVVAGAGAVGDRFRPVVRNMEGWLARIAGAHDQARAAAEAALALGIAALSEPHAHAHLDLAEIHLATGDVDAAAHEVDAVAERLDEVITMAWHVRQRLQFLRAQTAAGRGRHDEALALLGELLADTAQRGTRRYAVLGTLLHATESARGGVRVDVAALEPSLVAAAEVAAPEAWRLVAGLASATGDTRLWGMADDAAARLCAALDDPLTGTFTRYVDTVFAALRRPR